MSKIESRRVPAAADANGLAKVNGHSEANGLPPGADATGLAGQTEAPRTQSRPEPSMLHSILKPLASLRLTVVLFSLSLILVFFGTMAQIDKGIWTVVDQYFRSAFVWIPFQLGVKFYLVFFNDIFAKVSWGLLR